MKKFKDGLGGAVRRGKEVNYLRIGMGPAFAAHSYRKGHKIAESVGMGIGTGIENGMYPRVSPIYRGPKWIGYIGVTPWRTIDPDSGDFFNLLNLTPEGQSPAGKFTMRILDDWVKDAKV